MFAPLWKAGNLLIAALGWHPINERQIGAEDDLVAAQLEDRRFNVRGCSLWLATSKASDTLAPA